MIQLIIYSIAAFGLAYIIGHAQITNFIRIFFWEYCWFEGMRVETGGRYPFRILVELMECPACLGWWIGFISGLVGLFTQYQDVQLIHIGPPWIFPVILGLYTSGTNFILGRYTRLISPKTMDETIFYHERE